MKLRRFVACALSTTMVMGTTMSAFATDDNVATGKAPIFAFNKIDVVVPTTFATALNPGGLTVKIDASRDQVTSQVISKNYGIVNKSTTNQVVKVSFTVTDDNADDDGDKITFATSEDQVTNAAKGSYVLLLQAAPADAAVTALADDADIDKDTEATALADVKLTAATAGVVTLGTTASELAFKLDASRYALKTDSTLQLTTAQGDVAKLYEISALGSNSVTGFTFTGKMNTNTDWSLLPSGITISATYTFEEATGDETAIEGTGAAVEVGPQMTITADGLITITGLTSTKNYKNFILLYKAVNADVSADDQEYSYSDAGTWDNSAWTETDGGTLTFQLNDDWVAAITRHDKVGAVLTLSDDTTKTVSIQTVD